MQAAGQQEVLLACAVVALREDRRVEHFGVESVVELQPARGLLAIGENLAHPAKSEIVETLDRLPLRLQLSQCLRGKLSVLIVKAVVEDADLMQQPADMVGMLRRVGRSLGRDDEIVGRQVELVAIEIAAQNCFEAGFADGNLNPVGVDVTLERLHHAEKMPLRAEEPVRDREWRE